MSFIKNRSGFSLLEMTIAMGLAVGLLVFYMKMQGEQAKKAHTAKVSQEIDTFFTDFKATMDRPGFCNKSFENMNLSDNSSLNIQTVKNPRGDIRYKVGETYGGKTLKLNSITLKNFKPDDKEGFEGIATLELDIDKIGNIYGARKIFKTMEVSVTRDESRRILACGSLSSGGINLNLALPAAAATATSGGTTSTTTTETTHATTPSNTNTNPATTTPDPSHQAPAAGSGQSENDQRKALMQELEKNPELKRLQESFKQMQQNPVDADEDL